MNLTVIYTHEDHLELVNALVLGIKEKYQITASIHQKETIKKFDDQTLYIFVDLHHFFKEKSLPKHYIMYNFLQAQCRKKKTLRVKEQAKNAIQLWDYSQINLKFFQQQCPGIKPVYVPFGYSKSYELSKPEQLEKTKAVGFLGDLGTPRRQKIVNSIKKVTGYDVSTSKIKLFGDAKARFLKSTKIMLNIHKVDTATILETARLVTLLSNGCFVISEKSTDQELMKTYTGKVIFAEPNEIADLVEYYLKHEDEREEFAKSAYEWIKNEYQTAKFIPDLPEIINQIQN